MNIIGFSGLMGSGKSTAANYVRDMHSYKILSFAAPLKKAAEIIFDLDPMAFSEDGKKVIDPYWGITRREMLQKLGTECMRNVFFNDFWVKRAELTLRKVKGNHVVFDDVRFDEEAEWIKSKGGLVILITREGLAQSTHASEKGLANVTHVIPNNESMSVLFGHIEDCLHNG